MRKYYIQGNASEFLIKYNVNFLTPSLREYILLCGGGWTYKTRDIATHVEETHFVKIF